MRFEVDDQLGEDDTLDWRIVEELEISDNSVEDDDRFPVELRLGVFLRFFPVKLSCFSELSFVVGFSKFF